MMAENYYIPGMPDNLQGILFTPTQGQAEVKQLRAKHAGNRGAQQQLAVDDRYWQGKGMMQESPVAALAALGGSIPYDLAKLAYFGGPKPVKKLLAKVTERMFPGEGFNDQTTSRPAIEQTKAQIAGMAEAAYGALRDKIKGVNRVKFSDSTIDRLRSFTNQMNYEPTLATKVMELSDSIPLPLDKHLSVPQQARANLRRFAGKAVLAHGVDPVGTSLKVLSNVLQTAIPDSDTRQEFEPWMEPHRGMDTMGAIAPGMKSIKRMSPERKVTHEAEISKLLESWPKAKPVKFPINM